MGYYRTIITLFFGNEHCGRCVAEGFAEKNAGKILISAQKLVPRASYNLFLEDDANKAKFVHRFYADGKGRAELKVLTDFPLNKINAVLISSAEQKDAEVFGFRGTEPNNWRKFIKYEDKETKIIQDATPAKAQYPRIEHSEKNAGVDKSSEINNPNETPELPAHSDETIESDVPVAATATEPEKEYEDIQLQLKLKIENGKDSEEFVSEATLVPEEDIFDGSGALFPKASADRIFENNVHMIPFSYNDGSNIQWARASLSDLINLPIDYKKLINNPFICESFVKYRHVIIGRKESEDGEILILGVPNVFSCNEEGCENNEFKQFKSRSGVVAEGEHGYWLKPLT
ncbi:MAG: hypothetical protein LBM16_01060 [Clostridiales bacterium]|nr:hypothetical protein [Clostridiales bacterium]